MLLILFDIDGTLLWSGGAGVRALEVAFEELFAIPRAMQGVRCDGMTDPAIARAVLSPRGLASEGNILRILDRYADCLERSLESGSGFRLLPGVWALLSHLEGRPDVRCGLATGNLERGAVAKLRRGGLERFFSFGGYGSDAEDRAELVRTGIARGRKLAGRIEAAALVIGDTPRDVLAAQSAGARAAGVASGHYTLEELRRAGAEVVVSSLEPPWDWLEQIIRASSR